MPSYRYTGINGIYNVIPLETLGSYLCARDGPSEWARWGTGPPATLQT